MEIGSIFDINIRQLFREENKNEFYLPFMENKNYNYHYFFNTGRSAIEYLLKYLTLNNKSKKILLPAFNCSSVIDAVKRANVDYDFYTLTRDFRINKDSLLQKMDHNVGFVFIIQYFGSYLNQESYNLVNELKSKNIVIIEDISHALYTNHPKYIGIGNYVLGSIRKWLPIPDGAFLSSDREVPIVGLKSGYNEYSFNYFVAQLMKNVYLQEDSLGKTRFLELINKSTKSLFSDYAIREITDISYEFIHSYDFDVIIKKRLSNYNYLLDKVESMTFLKPFLLNKNGEVPFGFVILSNVRDRLLDHLIKNKIYSNIHWNIPDECKKADNISYELSRNILTIPCDQRYGEKEMNYIVNVLRDFEC